MKEPERAIARKVRKRGGGAAPEGGPACPQSCKHPGRSSLRPTHRTERQVRRETSTQRRGDGVRKQGSAWMSQNSGRGGSGRESARTRRVGLGLRRKRIRLCHTLLLLDASRCVPDFMMFSLALTRRIARPSLANSAFSFSRWYSATQTNFSTDGERLIHQKLTEKFKPTELHVEDVSGRLYSVHF